MKVVAHRGACTEAIENSWSAFEMALDASSDRIELDVHLTSDQQLVVIHDHSFERTTNSREKVGDLSRSEIESKIRLLNGEKVPFLDEVLEKYLNSIEFNIEVKDTKPDCINHVVKLIREQKNPSKIVVSSFDISVCETITREYPEIKVALLWEKSLILPGSFALGPGRIMQKNGIRIFHPDVRLVSKNLVSTIKNNGWEIIPYVSLTRETEPEELWSHLMSLDVDGLCTNYPRRLKLWLKEASDDKERFKSLHTVGAQNSRITD